jgi:UDP-N-acetyl-2-amino-2-deoxyglucuronate dehydrogenase
MAGSIKKIGVGVVGLGMVAKTHARSLRDLAEGVEVRGVFARDAVRRRAFAKEFGFPAAASIEALVEDPGVDAMLILTPPNARIELIELCARAGKHVLMEKPIERTTEAARQIVERCEAAGVKLGIVFQNRFRAASIAMRQVIADRRLGEMIAVQVAVPWWRPQSYYDEPGRGTFARDGGGVLITQAIHTLDLMLHLVGPVSEVQAVAGTTRAHRMESEDFVAGGFRLANGALGSLIATTAAFPGESERIALDFALGSVRLEGGVATLQFRDGRTERHGEASGTGGGGDPMAFPHDWHRAVIGDFMDAIRQDRPPAIPGRAALGVHCLIDALLRSARERRAVFVE